MAQMYNRVLRDLIDAGFKWTYNSKTLRRGGGQVYEMRMPEGKRWFKLHTRCHETRHRYWFGINHTALEQVDFVVLWMNGESRFYAVPSTFLQGLLAEYKPRGLVTIREGQWHVDVNTRWDELALPYVWQRYSLSDFAVKIPPVARCG